MCTVQYINGFRLKLIRFWCVDLRDPHNSTTGELEKDIRRSWYLSFSWVNGGRYRLSPLIISRSEYSVVSGFFRERRWHLPKNSRCVFFFENSCLSSRLQRCGAGPTRNRIIPTLFENFKNSRTDNFLFLSFSFVFFFADIPGATVACVDWQTPKTIRQSTARPGRRRQSEI
jgi:hypothetical protein